MRIVLPIVRSSRSSSRSSTRARGSRPGRRLVEQQHLRVVDEGVGQAQALLHAARQRLDVGVALVGEVDQLEQVADHPAAGGRAMP